MPWFRSLNRFICARCEYRRKCGRGDCMRFLSCRRLGAALKVRCDAKSQLLGGPDTCAGAGLRHSADDRRFVDAGRDMDSTHLDSVRAPGASRKNNLVQYSVIQATASSKSGRKRHHIRSATSHNVRTKPRGRRYFRPAIIFATIVKQTAELYPRAYAPPNPSARCLDVKQSASIWLGCSSR